MEVKCSILLFSTTNFYDTQTFSLGHPKLKLNEGRRGYIWKQHWWELQPKQLSCKIVKPQSDELKDSKNLVRDERNCKVRWKFSSQVTYYPLLTWKCSLWQLYHWYISTQIPPKQAIGLLKKKTWLRESCVFTWLSSPSPFKSLIFIRPKAIWSGAQVVCCVRLQPLSGNQVECVPENGKPPIAFVYDVTLLLLICLQSSNCH